MRVLLNYNQGQSIVETIVAFSVLILVLTAVVAVVVSSVSNATFVKNQSLANRYAQEAMEYLRDLEKNKFDQFNSYANGTYCMLANKSIDTTGPCSGPVIDGIFKRDLTFTKAGTNCKCAVPGPGCTGGAGKPSTQVTVAVSWESSKCPSGVSFCHKVELSSCFNSCYGSPCGRRGSDL